MWQGLPLAGYDARMALKDDQVRVGATIRELRELRRMSRRELARYLDISVSHLANIENGKRPCTLNHARKAADALHIRLTAITTESDDIAS